MKKLICLILSMLMLLSLAACGAEPEQAPTVSATLPATEPTEPESPFASLTPEERAEAEAEIRRAFSLLFDRNYIVEEIGQADQIPASSFVAPGFAETVDTEFHQNAGSNESYAGYFNTAPEAYEDNYVEAYSILAKYYTIDDNGAFSDFPAIRYLSNSDAGYDALGEYLQSVLTGIGIELQPDRQEQEVYREMLAEGGFSVITDVKTPIYQDPLSFLEMWTSASGDNYAGLGQGAHAEIGIYDLDLTELGYDIQITDGTWAETYDVLIGLIKECVQGETRYALLHRAEDLLMNTGAVVPVWFCTDVYLADRTVEGIVTTPLGNRFFHQTKVNRKGESLSVCLEADSYDLDPALADSADEVSVLSHLYAGLAKWTQDRNGNTSVIADCADRFPRAQVNEDGTTTYIYSLRRNARWSDGEPLTAYDFEYAWKRNAAIAAEAGENSLFAPVAGYSEMLAGEAGAELAVVALDEKRLQVTLKNDVTYWNELLAHPAYFPLREDQISREGWAEDPLTMVTNGAYTVTEWSENAFTLEKNPNYWDMRRVTMEKIRFLIGADFGSMLTNWKNDIWQFIDAVPSNRIAALKEEYSDEFTVAEQIGTYYVCWNINEPLLP